MWRLASARLAACVLAAALGAGGRTVADAAEVPAAGPATASPWQIGITPYAWAVSLHGDIGLAGVNADVDVDVDFSDLIKDVNGAAMLDLELRRGRFALLSGTVYANLEDSDSELDDRVEIKAKANQLIQTVAGSYRVGQWQLAKLRQDMPLGVAVDPYAGIRYTYLDNELDGKLDLPRLDIERSRTAQADKHWVDPIVGLRTTFALGDRLSLIAAADAGGTSQSEQYSWEAVGVLGYRVDLFGARNANLLAGYKILKQKFEDGDGRRRFEWDVAMQGPVVGLTINF